MEDRRSVTWRLAVVLLGLGATLLHPPPLRAGQIDFFTNATCAAPPCTSAKLAVKNGHKTVGITCTGTCTVDVYCKIAVGQTAVSVVQATGASAHAEKEFDSACGEHYATISVCTACHVWAVDVTTSADIP